MCDYIASLGNNYYSTTLFICLLTDQFHIPPFRREFWESFWWLTDSGVRTRCNSCEENVRFDLVDPLPHEETKAPPSFEKIQARLKGRSGALCSICCLTDQVRTVPFRREFWSLSGG